MISIDPKTCGLPPRTRVYTNGDSNYYLVIHRKSRIIMKDGQKIVDKIQILRKAFPKGRFTLETSAPVCSKTAKLLQQHDISIKTVKLQDTSE